MKLPPSLPLLFAAAFLFACPALAGEVPLGKFQHWKPADGKVAFSAGGARVTVRARACTPPEMPGDICTFGKGIYNSAFVTIEAPGSEPFEAEVNNAGAHYRIALVRLDIGDAVPGLIVESDPGGSGGGVVETVFAPRYGNWRRIELGYRGIGLPWGGWSHTFSAYLDDYPTDLNDDGLTDFVLADGKFAGSPFGCHACERQPPMILSPGFAEAADISGDPAFRPLFENALAKHRAECVAEGPDRNPACAAWMADAARLDRFAEAWGEMLLHYDRDGMLWQSCPVATYPCPNGRGSDYRDFPESLHAFLVHSGYIR